MLPGRGKPFYEGVAWRWLVGHHLIAYNAELAHRGFTENIATQSRALAGYLFSAAAPRQAKNGKRVLVEVVVMSLG